MICQLKSYRRLLICQFLDLSNGAVHRYRLCKLLEFQNEIFQNLYKSINLQLSASPLFKNLTKQNKMIKITKNKRF